MTQRVTLLGVPIDAVTMPQAIARLQDYLASGAQHHVATPNSEMLVESVHNAVFRSVLQKTALNLPDSSGLQWMARLTGQRLPARVAGVDAVMQLCSVLIEQRPVFLLGAREGVAERAAKALQLRNAHLRIAGTYAGSPGGQEAHAIVDRIREAAPAVLLVAFGAPTQDLWIAQYLSRLPSVRIAMGVGGTFDFLAGEVTRAPALLRAAGLEWMWRLLLQPQRWRRILRAVIVFPLLVAKYGKKETGSR